MKIIEASPVGEEVLKGHGAIVVGISINNSYFTNQKIREIMEWSFPKAKVYFMIPDEPSVHTLRALGYSEQEAVRKARIKSNNLENKCRKVGEELGLAKVDIIRWKKVSNLKAYKKSLERILIAYGHSHDFKLAIENTTRQVLKSNGVSEPKEDSLWEGVQFLLEELAFITAADEILYEAKVGYVYHKTMQILKDILERKYDFRASPNIGFITAE